jgi:hypothetical protein
MAFLLRKAAHGQTNRQGPIVVTFNAYMLSSRSSRKESSRYDYDAVTIRICANSANMSQSRFLLALARIDFETFSRMPIWQSFLC